MSTAEIKVSLFTLNSKRPTPSNTAIIIRIDSGTHESADPFAPLDAKRPNLDIMVEHCTNEHPRAYSDVSGLSLEQIRVLKAVISEKSGSPKIFPPLNS